MRPKKKHLKTGRFLRSLRRESRLSTNELASILGWSGAEIALLETGKRQLSIWHTWSIVKALRPAGASDAERSDRLASIFREALRLMCIDEGVPPDLIEYMSPAKPQESEARG